MILAQAMASIKPILAMIYLLIFLPILYFILYVLDNLWSDLQLVWPELRELFAHRPIL